VGTGEGVSTACSLTWVAAAIVVASAGLLVVLAPGVPAGGVELFNVHPAVRIKTMMSMALIILMSDSP
jgi:hypothetical protein